MFVSLIALLALLERVPCAQGQAPPVSPDGWTSDSVAITQASRAWMRALQDRDRPTLESLMTPEFALDTPGQEGAPLPKAQWLTNAFTILETDSAGYSVLHARRLGSDLAVSNGRLYWKVRLRGVPIPRMYHNVTDVWVRRAGRWQVAARDADLVRGPLASIAFAGGVALAALAWVLLAAARRWRRRRGQRAGAVPFAGAAQPAHSADREDER